MSVREALEQLEVIHQHIARSEVYRGFRTSAVALVGILAFAAAAVQDFVPITSAIEGFVAYWVAVAATCGLLSTAPSVYRYATWEDDFARRRTRLVLAQFSPCIIAGSALAVAAARAPALGSFLPGIWAALFGLSTIAASPYLPRGIGWIGFGYVVGGAASILRATPPNIPSGWAMGLVFGLGHLCTAFVLWSEKGGSDDGS